MQESENKTMASTKSAEQPEGAPTSNHNLQNMEETDDEDSSEEDEYEVESIIIHQMSDPSTHPEELGKKPVMLYKVKWKGFNELTWEPATSFEDLSIVAEYRKRVGLSKAGDSSDDVEMLEVG